MRDGSLIRAFLSMTSQHTDQGTENLMWAV
jgi:hypothetical protein